MNSVNKLTVSKSMAGDVNSSSISSGCACSTRYYVRSLTDERVLVDVRRAGGATVIDFSGCDAGQLSKHCIRGPVYNILFPENTCRMLFGDVVTVEGTFNNLDEYYSLFSSIDSVSHDIYMRSVRMLDGVKVGRYSEDCSGIEWESSEIR